MTIQEFLPTFEVLPNKAVFEAVNPRVLLAAGTLEDGVYRANVLTLLPEVINDEVIKDIKELIINQSRVVLLLVGEEKSQEGEYILNNRTELHKAASALISQLRTALPGQTERFVKVAMKQLPLHEGRIGLQRGNNHDIHLFGAQDKKQDFNFSHGLNGKWMELAHAGTFKDA